MAKTFNLYNSNRRITEKPLNRCQHCGSDWEVEDVNGIFVCSDCTKVTK